MRLGLKSRLQFKKRAQKNEMAKQEVRLPRQQSPTRTTQEKGYRFWTVGPLNKLSAC